MIEALLTMKTNEIIVGFVLNNMIFLLLVRACLDYVCKKTPWAVDDDLPSFFGGILDLITNKRKGVQK
ncbi:MAG: hypothetical protein GY710_08475 [Desulfobacteraceae bacterium]|nr:hypothetical protein [Desulfobacteraceae bacterium]